MLYRTQRDAWHVADDETCNSVALSLQHGQLPMPLDARLLQQRTEAGDVQEEKKPQLSAEEARQAAEDLLRKAKAKREVCMLRNARLVCRACFPRTRQLKPFHDAAVIRHKAHVAFDVICVGAGCLADSGGYCCFCFWLVLRCCLGGLQGVTGLACCAQKEEAALRIQQEKDRIRYGKELQAAKREEDSLALKRNLEARRIEKEEERRAREKIRLKLGVFLAWRAMPVESQTEWST